MDTKIVLHQDYHLHCSARATDQGQFVPVVVATRAVWPTRPRNIAVEPGAFPDAAAATEAALAQGIGWVKNYG